MTYTPPVVGVRVFRGPDWDDDTDADGGEGHLGTVSEMLTSGIVQVIWDVGQESTCRAGHQGKFDLRIFDTATVGVHHDHTICRSCGEKTIYGILWRCSECPGWDLCSPCYADDKHDLRHQFLRIDWPGTPGKLMKKRKASVRVRAMGLFPGAKVTRGKDWQWQDQDGGAGSEGDLVEIKSDANRCGRGNLAKVRWSSGKANIYRLAFEGHVDIQCTEEEAGGFYYRDHQPSLDVADFISLRNTDTSASQRTNTSLIQQSLNPDFNFLKRERISAENIPETCPKDDVPVTDASSDDSVTDSRDLVTITDPSNDAPVTDSKENALVTDSRDLVSITDSDNDAPVTDFSNDASVTDSRDLVTITDSDNDAPVTDSSNDAPVTDSSNGAPVTDSSNDAPVTDSSNDAPVTDSSNDAPMTDSRDLVTVTDSNNDAPVTDTSSEELMTGSKDYIPVTVSRDYTPMIDFKDDEKVTESESRNDEPVTDSNDDAPVTATKDDIQVKAIKDDVPMTDSEDDVPMTESEDGVPLTNIKDDVPITDSKDKALMTDSKDDVLVTISREASLTNPWDHSAVKDSRDDAAMTNSRETAVADPNHHAQRTEYGVENSTHDTTMTNCKHDASVRYLTKFSDDARTDLTCCSDKVSASEAGSNWTNQIEAAECPLISSAPPTASKAKEEKSLPERTIEALHQQQLSTERKTSGGKTSEQTEEWRESEHSEAAIAKQHLVNVTHKAAEVETVPIQSQNEVDEDCTECETTCLFNEGGVEDVHEEHLSAESVAAFDNDINLNQHPESTTKIVTIPTTPSTKYTTASNSVISATDNVQDWYCKDQQLAMSRETYEEQDSTCLVDVVQCEQATSLLDVVQCEQTTSLLEFTCYEEFKRSEENQEDKQLTNLSEASHVNLPAGLAPANQDEELTDLLNITDDQPTTGSVDDSVVQNSAGLSEAPDDRQPTDSAYVTLNQVFTDLTEACRDQQITELPKDLKDKGMSAEDLEPISPQDTTQSELTSDLLDSLPDQVLSHLPENTMEEVPSHLPETTREEQQAMMLLEDSYSHEFSGLPTSVQYSKTTALLQDKTVAKTLNQVTDEGLSQRSVDYLTPVAGEVTDTAETSTSGDVERGVQLQQAEDTACLALTSPPEAEESAKARHFKEKDAVLLKDQNDEGLSQENQDDDGLPQANSLTEEISSEVIGKGDHSKDCTDGFRVGDNVAICVPEETLKELQAGFGGVTISMIKKIGQMGTVTNLKPPGTVGVRLGNMVFRLNPACLVKVHQFKTGDKVRIREDLYMLQILNERLGWRSQMDQTLGKVGEVMKVDEDRDLLVSFGQRSYGFSPACCLPAADSTVDWLADRGSSRSLDNNLTESLRESSFLRERLASLLPSGGGGRHRIRLSDLAELSSAADLLELSTMSQLRSMMGGGTLGLGDEDSEEGRLQKALLKGDVDKVKDICRANPSLLNRPHHGLTPLMLASHQGKRKLVLALLDLGADVNSVGIKEQAALGVALDQKEEEMALLLLEKGANPLHRNGKDRTPLHMAVFNSLNEVAQILIHMGADLNAQDKYGDTPLHDAIARQNTPMVDLLLQLDNVNVLLINRKGYTPLQLACRVKNTQMVGRILTRDCSNVNQLKDEDLAALHIAVSNNFLDGVQLLITIGNADVNLPTGRQGLTALHMACLRASSDSVQLLLELGADVNVQDATGETPLHLAMGGQSSEDDKASDVETRVQICRLLLTHGAFVDATNKKGRQPTTYGRSEVQVGVLQFIEQNPELIRRKSSQHITAWSGPKQSSMMTTAREFGTDLVCSQCQGKYDVRPIPCGHKTVCRVCSDVIKFCPTCGTKVDSTERAAGDEAPTQSSGTSSDSEAKVNISQGEVDTDGASTPAEARLQHDETAKDPDHQTLQPVSSANAPHHLSTSDQQSQSPCEITKNIADRLSFEDVAAATDIGASQQNQGSDDSQKITNTEAAMSEEPEAAERYTSGENWQDSSDFAIPVSEEQASVADILPDLNTNLSPAALSSHHSEEKRDTCEDQLVTYTPAEKSDRSSPALCIPREIDSGAEELPSEGALCGQVPQGGASSAWSERDVLGCLHKEESGEGRKSDPEMDSSSLFQDKGSQRLHPDPLNESICTPKWDLKSFDPDDDDLELPDLPSMPAGGGAFGDWIVMGPRGTINLNESKPEVKVRAAGDNANFDPWSFMAKEGMSDASASVCARRRGSPSQVAVVKEEKRNSPELMNSMQTNPIQSQFASPEKNLDKIRKGEREEMSHSPLPGWALEPSVDVSNPRGQLPPSTSARSEESMCETATTEWSASRDTSSYLSDSTDGPLQRQIPPGAEDSQKKRPVTSGSNPSRPTVSVDMGVDDSAGASYKSDASLNSAAVSAIARNGTLTNPNEAQLKTNIKTYINFNNLASIFQSFHQPNTKGQTEKPTQPPAEKRSTVHTTEAFIENKQASLTNYSLSEVGEEKKIKTETDEGRHLQNPYGEADVRKAAGDTAKQPTTLHVQTATRVEGDKDQKEQPSQRVNSPQRETTPTDGTPGADDRKEEITTGDNVMIKVSEETLINMQQEFGGTTKGMLQCIGKTGTVTSQSSRGAICVRFRSLAYRFNPLVLMTVPTLSVGDVVRIHSDLDLLKLLNKRVTDCSGIVETLGKAGKISKIDEDGNVTVSFAQSSFRYSPACCVPAPGATIDTVAASLTENSKVDGNNFSTSDEKFVEGQAFTKMLAEMVQSGTSVDQILRSPRRDFSNISRLFEAIRNDNAALVIAICQSDPSLMSKVHEDHRLTPLMYASWKGRLRIVRELLEMGADINRTVSGRDVPDSCSPLFAALESGEEETAAFLLQHGADPNCRSSHRQRTPLHSAAYYNHVQILQLLLQRYIDVNAKDNVGDTALMDALMHDSRAAVDILLAVSDVDVTVTNRKGITPLHIACVRNMPRAVEQILARDTSQVNKLMRGEFSPLHIAADRESVEIIRLLVLNGGADVNVQAGGKHGGDRPLHLACRRGHFYSVEALLDFGAEVNARNREMDTPLHFAMGGRGIQELTAEEAGLIFHEERVRIACTLISNGAFVDMENAKGRTCMRYGGAAIQAAVQDFMDRNRHLVQKRGRREKECVPTLVLRNVPRPCAVCKANMSDVTLLPCGHKTTCSTCAQAVVTCPLCQRRVDSTTTDDRMGALFEAIT